MSTASDAVERVRQLLLSPYRSGVDDGGMLTLVYNALAAVEAAGATASSDVTALAARATALEALTYPESYNFRADGSITTIQRTDCNSAAQTTATQRLVLSYFTARKALTSTQVQVTTGSTAAAATPTLCRVGLYSIAANGDGTLVASHANDTAMFATQNLAYTKTWTAPVDLVAGTRYAVGILVVSAGATPTFLGVTPGVAFEFTRAPAMANHLAGQADLPASFLAASLANAPLARIYTALLP